MITKLIHLELEDKDKIIKASKILSIAPGTFIRTSAVKEANRILKANGGLS